MASFPDLRPGRRSAKAESKAALRSRARVLIAVSAALLLTAFTAVSELATLRGAKAHDASAFLTRELGPPLERAPLVRTPARGVKVRIDPHGYSVTRGPHSVSLRSATTGGPWKTFAHGSMRTTPYGTESITVTGQKTELFLTVPKHFGQRTWQWRLDGTNIKPTLRSDGSVALARDGSLEILPVAILDESGRNITPTGLKWSLSKSALSLRLDDSKLPVPYLIDPASNYPTPINLRNTASAVTGSWRLATGTGTVDTTTSNTPAQNATGWYAFSPGLSTTTQQTSLPVNPVGAGWIIEPVGGATGFPAGAWTFTVQTDIPNATLVAGTAVLTVGIWKGTVSGSTFTQTGVVMTPTDDPAAQNLRTTVNPTTTNVTYNLGKISLAAGETLYVEFWRHQTGGINANQAARRALDFYVNDGVAKIQYPNPDDGAPTGNVSITGATGAYYNSGTGTLYYRGVAAGSFSFRDAITDTAGTGTASGAFQVNYPAIATTGWVHANENVTTSPNFQSATYSWSASPSSPAAQILTQQDNALNNSTSTVTFSNDSTIPTGTVTAPAASANVSGSAVTVSSTDAADGGSGVASVQFQYSAAGAGSWNNIGSADTTSPYSVSWDTTALTDGLYDLRALITDNVGNVRTTTTVTNVRVDNTKPTNSISVQSPSPAGAVFQNGTTIWYRGAAAGNFQLSNTVSDGGSGPASGVFPALGGTVGTWTHSAQTVNTPAGGPYTTTNNFAWSAGETNSPTEAITSTDNAGNTSNTTTLTFSNDSTAPSTTDDTASIGSAWRNTSATVTLTPNDAASGTATTYYTTDGSTPTAASPQGTSITLSATGVYTIKYFSVDNVGNTESVKTASTQIRIDTAAPANSLSLVTVSGNSVKSGSTVFYRGSVAGSFRVRNAVTDADSGPASSATAALGGTTTGWTHTPSTVSTPAGGPYDSSTFSWSAGTTSSPTEVVTGADTAGNTTAAGALTFTNDSTAPTVVAPGVTAAYYTSLSVPVTMNTGFADDGSGSGVDATTSILERESATLGAGGSCTSWTGTWVTVALSGGNDTGVANGHCYRYRELLSDRVANQGTSANSNVAMVDNAGPSNSLSLSGVSPAGSALKSGATIYYRGVAAGSFKLTNAAGDDESGPASSATAALGGTTTGWTHTPSTVSTPSGGPFDSNAFSWSAGTTSSPTEVVTGADTAGNTTAAGALTFTNDSTAPSVAAPGVTAAYYTSLSVPVTVNTGSATDGGSGVDATTSILERESGTLGSGGSCTWSGIWSTVTLSAGNDTSVLNGRCYRYHELLSDQVGNQGTSPLSNVAKVDSQAPSNSLTATTVSPAGSVFKSGAAVFYRGSAAGSFTLTNAVGDGESGPASSATAALGGTSTGWSHSPSTVSSPAGGPYESNTFSWSAGTTSSPTEVVTGADTAGNNTAAATLTFTSDSATPTGGALTVNGVAATGITPVSYDTDGSFPIDVRTDYSDGAGESGLSASTLVRTSATFSSTDTCGSFGSPVTISGNPSQGGLASGCYKYTLTGTDNVGNTASIATTVKVDTDNPNVSLTDPGTPLAGTIGLDASASDGSTGVQQVAFQRAPAGGSTWTTIGSDSSAPFTTNWNTTGVSDGMYDVRAVATDTAGNSDASLVANRRVDNTAPDTTIDASPPDPSNDATPTFDFSSSESGSTFQCRVDGGSWSSCTSPDTLSAQGEGSHTFDVRATDQAGNTDASPASYTWAIDLTAPNTMLDSSPASPSANTTPTFTFHSSESGSTFECRIDGGSWTSCSSPHTISPALSEGSRTFDVRATDQAGNTDGSPASHTWIIDIGPPDTSIDSSPSSPSNDTTPTFTFSSTEPGSTFECRIDGGSWSACTSPDTISPALGEGSHTFDVRATDVASNTDPSPASYTWTIDVTPPNTTIDSAPADPSNDATPTFSFSATESGSTFECRVDGGSWSACTSPETLPALGAGSHTFDVRATDQAGNTDPSPAGFTWMIDLTAPDTTIDTSPADPSNDTTPTFTFSSTEPGSSFECRVDGGSWSACTSPETLPALGAGSHTFDVRASDQAGNTDPSPAGFTWTIDLTAPDTTIDTGPANPSNDATPTFSFSATEPGSTFECRVDGGSWSACTSPETLPALGAGSHTLDVRATDQAGNTDASPASYSWTIDLTAPDTTIDTSPGDPSNDTTPTLTFSSTEPGSTFECRIDGGGWTSCSSPHTITPALAGGSHTFDVRATDQAGNTDPSPAGFTWTIDLTAPNTTIDTSPTDPSNDATPTFTFRSTESGSTYECRIDGGSWTSCSSPHTITPALSEGSHTFDVRATDQADNTDSTPAGYTWVIDGGAPTVTITAPTVYINAADPNNYTVTASTPDSDVTHVDFFECSNPSTACATGSWNQFATDNAAPYQGMWSTPVFDGPKAIRAVAFDAAGNTGQHIRTITIDRTAPTNVSVTFPNGYVVGSYAIATENGPDSDVNASTGVLERRTGDLANDTCSSYGGWIPASSPDSLASGKCAQYRYSVADNAGNVTLATSGNEVKSDTAAPTSSLTDPGANLRQTITLSASAGDTEGSGIASVTFQRRPAGGGSWTTIASDGTAPYSVSFDTTSVGDGIYDLRSVATDNAANVESAPVIVANRRIDNTAPSATMVSPGNPVGGTVALTSNTSDIGGSGIATVDYELAPNGGSYNTQSASWDTTLVSDGLYDLRVVATDVAGNSATSAAITTRVDNTPPAVTFTSPAGGTVVSGTVNLVGSATDASPAGPAVTFAYKLNSDPASAYTATGAAWNTAALPAGDGLYDLRARATDDAGNTGTTENTSIRVDNAPPTIAITAPAAAINGSVPSPTTFAANASDPGGSGVSQVQFFECSDQSNDCSTGVWNPLGAVPGPGPYGVSWSIPAADGNHALAAVATDNAGHPATAIRNVNVDRTAPNTAIVSKPADPSNDAVPSFTFSSTEPGSTFECSIDGSAFAPCTSPHNVPGLSDNDHTFDVRATDAAGNTDVTPASWTWHRDTNAPSATLNNPGANVRQMVTLTSNENDPPADGYASGISSVAFEYSANGTTWAPIGTNTSPPFDSVIWNTSAVSDGVYQLRIIVHDAAGNSTTDLLGPTVRIDNTPPTTSQNDPGQYLRATETLAGSAADSGSGIDHVDFERAPTGSGSWTTIATDSTPGDGFQVSFDTTGVADGHYDFRTVAYDVAGNQAPSSPVTDRLVDNTPPDATMNNPGPYLRGAVNLTSSTGDPGGANASGVVSVAYEYSTNAGGTWQSTGASFNSAAVPDGSVDLHVVATDAAGNTTTSASVSSLVDNTKPSTSDNAPSGWQSSAVTVTLSPSDAGSGVNVTEYSVDGNPTYTVGTSVTIPAPADGSNDGAHTIAYFSADNAGNIETIKSTTVLIDATPPACPSCSAADYLRGTVDLSADPDSGGSGIKSVAFEYTDAGGSIWTTIGTDTTGPGPFTATWDTTLVPDGHYDLRIVITDNADNVTTADLPDKVVDNTAPDLALVGAPTEGQLVTGTIAITASASDVTSPIASVKFYVRGALIGTDTVAPFSQSWDTTTGADGGATISVVVEDMAGNTTTSSTRNVLVDNVSPTPTLADPGQFLSGTVSLSASSDPDTTQVDFERRPAGGGSWVTIASDTTTPWDTSLDTTTLADGLYDFRAVATDSSGHTGTSPIRANVQIDNGAPAGSLTAPANGATVGGTSVSLTGAYSDGGSGVASVRYELRTTGGGSWTTIATATGSPFSATWDATSVASGSYDLQPVITDRAGNTFTGALHTITVDVTAPTVVLTNPGSTISGLVTLNATVTGSGATQVAFTVTPAGGGTWTSLGTDTSAPWSTPFDTTRLADGLYDLRATVSDSLGNSSFDDVASIWIDNSAPRLVSSSPAEGSTVGSANAIGLVASEPATAVGVTLDGSATVAPVINGTHLDYGTGPLAPGAHTLAGELQDSSGKKAAFRVHFTVWSTGGSTPAPPVNKNTGASTDTTVESADGFASATMPAGAWSTSGSDWIVLRITPLAAPTGLTNGFAPGPEALDVTARWALSGAEVHQFSRPIAILMRTTEKGLVPATYENGAWRVLARVPNSGTLPAGWEDGFYADSTGFHVLTTHLSLFALLRDVAAPNAPQNVRGYLAPGGLTLRWTPGNDNSGTYDFLTLFSDSNDAGHFGVDYTAASIGGWAVGDPRVFRLKETDLAGNESPLTPPLRPVPSLVGKTPEQAAALLAPLGFKLGTVTTGGTGPAGTITGPAGLVLAEEGATIDVTVSADGSLTKLAFKVITAPKLRPAVRKNIAARVSVTRAARVTAELYSPRRVKLYTWRFSVKAGQTIVKLRLPRQVRRTGVYSMRWTARSGRETITRKLTIRLIGPRNVNTQPVEVLLAGPAADGVGGKLTKAPRIVRAASVEPTFDAAASRRSDVRVIVVDVDAFGVPTIRDLHAVFPSVKIVALTSSPRKMTAALKAGASVALPRSTPAAVVTRVIQRLLTKPANSAKPAGTLGAGSRNLASRLP